jgi:hypothetical protein
MNLKKKEKNNLKVLNISFYKKKKVHKNDFSLIHWQKYFIFMDYIYRSKDVHVYVLYRMSDVDNIKI